MRKAPDRQGFGPGMPTKPRPRLGKFIRSVRSPGLAHDQAVMRKSGKREDWMHSRFAVFCVAGMLLAGPAFGQGAYRILNSYTLGGEGGWDYLNLDPDSGHLFITRGSHVMVVDPATGKQLADITGLQG